MCRVEIIFYGIFQEKLKLLKKKKKKKVNSNFLILKSVICVKNNNKNFSVKYGIGLKI